MEKELKLLNEIGASLPAGSTAYLVGGAVRDIEMSKIAGVDLTPKDFDVEVFGMSPYQLACHLRDFGKVVECGTFAVIKLRTDGKEYDFTVPDAPTPYEASFRRDFTMNALYRNLATGEVLDFHGGIQDMADRRLRIVGERFGEDPLRVLRAFQFIARFALTPDRAVVDAAIQLLPEAAAIPKERVWEEWKKWILKGIVFEDSLIFLKDTGWGELLFPALDLTDTEELAQTLKKLRRDLNIDRALMRAADPDAPELDPLPILLALVCTFGNAGAFLNQIGCQEKNLTRRVMALVNGVAKYPEFSPRYTDAWCNELSLTLAPATIREYTWVLGAKKNIRDPLASTLATMPSDFVGNLGGWQQDALVVLLATANELGVIDRPMQPLVTGKVLMDIGLQPGREFGDILRQAKAAQANSKFTDLDGAKAWLKEFLAD